MKRGRILAAALAFAGIGMLAFGAGSTPASADPYCGPGLSLGGGLLLTESRPHCTIRRLTTRHRLRWLSHRASASPSALAAVITGAKP